MKAGAKRRYKLLALLASVGLCLSIYLLCVSKRRQETPNRNSSSTTGPNGARLNSTDLSRPPKRKLYKPKIVVDGLQLENLKQKLSETDEEPSRYLIVPHKNVIECEDGGTADRMQSSENATTLLIVINSRADNFERRRRLRSDWIHRSNLKRELCVSPALVNNSSSQPRIASVRWVFVLGRLGHTVATREVGRRIRQEAELYGDVLMMDLLESYRNMTRKHLALLSWLVQERDGLSLSGRDLVLKCDDDARLDLGQLVGKYMHETSQSPEGPLDLLMCARFEENSLVLRKLKNQTTKWSLSDREWPYDTFPAYCSGLAYLASLDLLEKLHLIAPLVASQDSYPPLWIDDVYVTGVLLAALELPRLKLVRLNSYFCYTRAQRLHRESLEPGVRCMAAEIDD